MPSTPATATARSACALSIVPRNGPTARPFRLQVVDGVNGWSKAVKNPTSRSSATTRTPSTAPHG